MQKKSKVMVNSNYASIHAYITLYGNKLKEVNKFSYIGATLSKDRSCEIEIKIILALAISAMIRLYTIYGISNISTLSKITVCTVHLNYKY